MTTTSFIVALSCRGFKLLDLPSLTDLPSALYFALTQTQAFEQNRVDLTRGLRRGGMSSPAGPSAPEMQSELFTPLPALPAGFPRGPLQPQSRRTGNRTGLQQLRGKMIQSKRLMNPRKLSAAPDRCSPCCRIFHELRRRILAPLGRPWPATWRMKEGRPGFRTGAPRVGRERTQLLHQRAATAASKAGVLGDALLIEGCAGATAIRITCVGRYATLKHLASPAGPPDPKLNCHQLQGPRR